MDFAAHDLGLHTTLALDKFPAATDTFKKHFPDSPVVTSDIYEFNNKSANPYPSADFLMGGYPCQPFSMGGMRDPSKDDRSSLFIGFAGAVNKIKPKAFIAENVSGLSRLENGDWLRKQLEVYETQLSVKYNVKYLLVDAADYGVPQHRKRLFIVGVKKSLDFDYEFPEPTHCKQSLVSKTGLLPHASHGAAIAHLNPYPTGEYYERPHDPSGNFSWYFMSRNRRARWDKPSYTIVANLRHTTLHPASPKMIMESSDLKNGFKQKWVFSNEYDHHLYGADFPELNPPRRFSWQEAAAIQTFPAEFEPEGTLMEKFEQIGNAVPPLLMRHVLANLMPIW
jgi:DNA (cytosine-5)-methyltransferase 1